jgi:drug/metabolite transporter (DMT)-like permease
VGFDGTGGTTVADDSIALLETLRKRTPAAMSCARASGSLMPLALPALVTEDYGAVTLEGWGALAYAMVLTGVVTNLLYFTAIGRVGPSRAAIFGCLQSFLGVLFPIVVLLTEQVTPVQLAGGSW